MRLWAQGVHSERLVFCFKPSRGPGNIPFQQQCRIGAWGAAPKTLNERIPPEQKLV